MKPTVEAPARESIRVRDVVEQLGADRSTLDSADIHQVDFADVVVDLVATRQPWGGSRWWLVCPDCDRRCSQLFVHGARNDRRLGCRRCHGLGYRAFSLSPADRHRRRADMLRDSAGGVFGTMPTVKPRGMRWATFDRLLERAQEHDEQADAIELQGLVATSDALVKRVRGGGTAESDDGSESVNDDDGFGCWPG